MLKLHLINAILSKTAGSTRPPASPIGAADRRLEPLLLFTENTPSTLIRRCYKNTVLRARRHLTFAAQAVWLPSPVAGSVFVIPLGFKAKPNCCSKGLGNGGHLQNRRVGCERVWSCVGEKKRGQIKRYIIGILVGIFFTGGIR